MKEWLKRARSLKLPDLLGALRSKLQGYWNYYAVRGNSSMTAKLLSGGHIPPLQMAQPSQPAAVLDLEPVPHSPPFLETAPTAHRQPFSSIDVALAFHSSIKCLLVPCPLFCVRVHPRSPVR